jgi:hypothetical protein
MSKVFESFLPDEDFPPEHETGEAWVQLQEVYQVAVMVARGATLFAVLPSSINREMYVLGVRTAESITVGQYIQQSKFDRLVKEPHPRDSDVENHIADAAVLMRLLRLFAQTGDSRAIRKRTGL